jgi:uncharacterized protein YggE
MSANWTTARLLAALLSLTAAIVAAPAARAQVPGPPVPRSITVTGESTVYVAPDEVIIRVGVETAAPSIEAAKKENDQRSRTLLDAVKHVHVGVEAKHIQTADVQLEIDYRNDNDGAARVVKGYVARREYTVTLKDPKKTEALVDASLTSGANLLLGIDYRSTELRKHRDEARRMAVKAAKEKANLLAGELGETVGRARSVSEGAFGYYPWSSFGRGASYMTQNSFQVQGGGEGVAGETIPIGHIGITASVSVTFDLRD